MPRTRSSIGPDTPIPDKLYFKIGEVSQLVGVRAHVLRYWEKEVPSIRPGKSASNQRRYRFKDVEIFREIRRLLHEERYTLAGARKRILQGDRDASPGGTEPDLELGGSHDAPLADDASAFQDDPYLADGDDVAEPDADREQLPLGFVGGTQAQRLERVRTGLRELIRMAGEEP